MKVLFCALSVRAMVQAGSASGYECVGADCFGDVDTLASVSQWFDVADSSSEFPRIDHQRLLAAIEHSGCDCVVLGAGLEADLPALDQLAQSCRLVGSPPAVWRTCHDPFALSDLAASVGLSVPPTLRQQDRTRAKFSDANWLVKSQRGYGGTHVRQLTTDLVLHAEDYIQQWVDGEPVSLTCIVTDGVPHILGANRQLFNGEVGSARFSYLGAISGYQLAPERHKQVADAVCRLLIALQIQGLCSVDLLVGNQIWLLEVNPRWSGSVALYDAPGLLQAHIGYQNVGNPSAGDLNTESKSSALGPGGTVRGVQTVYSVDCVSWPDREWPDWVADRAAPGTVVKRHHPLCTIHADGPNEQSVRELLAQRCAAILEIFLSDNH